MGEQEERGWGRCFSLHFLGVRQGLLDSRPTQLLRPPTGRRACSTPEPTGLQTQGSKRTQELMR